MHQHKWESLPALSKARFGHGMFPMTAPLHTKFEKSGSCSAFSDASPGDCVDDDGKTPVFFAKWISINVDICKRICVAVHCIGISYQYYRNSCLIYNADEALMGKHLDMWWSRHEGNGGGIVTRGGGTGPRKCQIRRCADGPPVDFLCVVGGVSERGAKDAECYAPEVNAQWQPWKDEEEPGLVGHLKHGRPVDPAALVPWSGNASCLYARTHARTHRGTEYLLRS